MDRLMLETDSPYFMPRNVPGKWGQNWHNEPCLIPFIAKKIAHVRRDCTEAEVAIKTTEVAKEFFKM
jgi:TatD DNase family protein